MNVTKCLYCGGPALTKVTQRSDDMGILKCDYCGIMMVERISDDAAKQLYGADYFEKKEDTKSGYTDYLSSPAAKLMGKYGFSRLFAKVPGNHLDLGAADGSLLEIFTSGGFASQGLEISAEAVALGREKGLHMRTSSLHGFPKGLPRSDIITAFDLLEHADQPRSVLTAAYNNLVDGGYFVFSTLSVHKEDPSDYWLCHSLEHYIYYNRNNLTYALNDVFGEGAFSFVEVEVNGVFEFWGVARKGGKLTSEKRIIDLISQEDFDRSDATAGYFLSLFYDQVSRFAASERVIKYFTPQWTHSIAAQASFYNLYFQGMFERAIERYHADRTVLPAVSSVYWQALSYVQEQFAGIKQAAMTEESTAEVLGLREQIFRLRDELHGLRHARVLGRIIRLRDIAGSVRRRIGPIPKLPRRIIHKTRVIVAPFVPAPARRTVKQMYRKMRAVMRRQPAVQTEWVANARWKSKYPLLTVVMPYYNLGTTIDDALNSLLAQTYRDFEVIVVNDGSTEQASVDKLQGIEKRYASLRLRVIQQNNQGVAEARNTGMKQAHGKYIVCLDSDDMLEPTYLEKCLVVLEGHPDIALATAHQQMFGVTQELYKKKAYDPFVLYHDNMVLTAAVFRKRAWEVAGGFLAGIGYEDWEFWIRLAEHGFWGRLIPEALFCYRTALQSRYVDDKDKHWNTIKAIRALHPEYRKKISRILARNDDVRHLADPETAFINLDNPIHYAADTNRPNVLITIPWMTFGGAETLIYNYCREVNDAYNLSFVTGLHSEHEWEYKFKEITPNIYHLSNLFEDERLYVEFISNYIKTRHVDILHVIHNGFTFEMLETLKARHPKLKVIVTMFNDRVEYFEQSTKYEKYIDIFVSDNQKVAQHYQRLLNESKSVRVIPNGINCFDEFSSRLFNREARRKELGLASDDLAVFFVGRLSPEKNPDVFLRAAATVLEKGIKHVQFFMIGDGPMRSEIDALLSKIDDKRVHYLGYQSKVAQFLSAADIFVLPSAIEGFPLSILEAMAMETVVIASDVGAVAQVVESGKSGFVITPGSAKEIVALIARLTKNRSLMTSMKHAARDEVEAKYSNIKLGENYRRLYRETLAL